MNSVANNSTVSRQKVWRAALACSVLLSACATGPNNVVVSLPDAPQQVATSSAAPKNVTIRIDSVKDARPDAVGGLIGERNGLGGMSMGTVELQPPPTEVIRQLLKTELTRMGYSVVDSDAQLALGAQLLKFQIATPASALYWDINGTIEFALVATAQNLKKHDARYAAACTDRTYVWPSEEVIGKVIAECVGLIGAKIRNDPNLANL
jgi:uncharacterized lipoprotein YajG